MEFLSTKFVEEYVKEHENPLTELGEFVYYRTYSRWLESKGRREYWHETVKRAIEYIMALEFKHTRKIGYKPDLKKMKKEAESLFINVYSTKQFPSGRTLWLGNGNEKINKDFVMGNFNCFSRDTQFVTDKGVKSFEDFEDSDVVNVLNETGKWAPATVKNFGKSEIYKLTVKRGKQVDVINTTANHRWYAKNTVNYSKFDTRTTVDLKQGDVLRSDKKYEFENRTQNKFWSVVSVEPTGEFEDVWCVQEPETESFTLGNGILTKNCSFLNIEVWDDLAELFYLLMVGTGVGFKSTKAMAAKMGKIRTNTTLLHSEYKPVDVDQRLEDTKVVHMDNGFSKIYVGDSKNGWVNALGEYLKLLTEKEHEAIHTIKISYNSVRPKGEKLKTFGGTASGHEPLQEMFDGIDKVFKNQIDNTLDPIEIDEKGYGNVRPVHILDIGNLIGNNVVVGGVRRTAEIFLFDSDDFESMFAKYGMNGIWTEEQMAQHIKVGKMLDAQGIKPVWFDTLGIGVRREGIDHRRMSNNSIAFSRKPEKEFLDLVFELMQLEGEPGFVNLESAGRRVLNSLGNENPTRKQLDSIIYQLGLNPCVEVILFSKNVCNLTTINVKAFVENGKLDTEGLIQAQKYSARMGLRMTLATLELPNWDAIQQRDRLLGVSLTGWKDAMDLIDYTFEQENELKALLHLVAREEADSFSKQLRVNAPMFVTAIKPEGTLSQVAGGVSSGLHWSHSPHFIRRIRVSATDPLAKVAKDLDWNIHAEVGTSGVVAQEKLSEAKLIEEAKTIVIDFPVESGAKQTKADISVDEQFDNYFSFQELYTEMNTSNTIDVKAGEWKQAEQRVIDGWDNFVGVSFLAHDGGTYTLAPYEAVTKEEHDVLKASMKPFDPLLLRKYEQSETLADLENMDSCSSGVCPIR